MYFEVDNEKVLNVSEKSVIQHFGLLAWLIIKVMCVGTSFRVSRMNIWMPRYPVGKESVDWSGLDAVEEVNGGEVCIHLVGEEVWRIATYDRLGEAFRDVAMRPCRRYSSAEYRPEFKSLVEVSVVGMDVDSLAPTYIWSSYKFRPPFGEEVDVGMAKTGVDSLTSSVASFGRRSRHDRQKQHHATRESIYPTWHTIYEVIPNLRLKRTNERDLCVGLGVGHPSWRSKSPNQQILKRTTQITWLVMDLSDYVSQLQVARTDKSAICVAFTVLFLKYGQIVPHSGRKLWMYGTCDPISWDLSEKESLGTIVSIRVW
ncbi:hypothetical protein QBC38DRAFT_549631 [Podospora fimiseda]|uniref:Uncharacterized protein n=1 Tax=Podospora fimiseda TaxID=252190 RepID=A0AAN7BGL6_9PEZI|nr:hypothetical protein QBC38DRAFT_549631 [Podospora fimiseda]